MTSPSFPGTVAWSSDCDSRPTPACKARRPLNVWTAYRLGMRLKASFDGPFAHKCATLARLIASPRLMSRWLTPIDYVRYRELDFALRAVERYKPSPRCVLDISSPKLVPLAIAHQYPRAAVRSTDIIQTEIDWVTRSAHTLDLPNLQPELADARKLEYDDNAFDLITSISVFEHIAPETDGELPAVREMARVLAPGGVAVLTVPFSHKYFADYVAGDVYERSGHPGKPIFFQRFYDLPLLKRNIIDASGLELVDLRFIEERYFFRDPRRRMAHYINASPRQRLWIGPLYPLLSHVFLSSPKALDRCTKPYLACIVLRKPRVGPGNVRE